MSTTCHHIPSSTIAVEHGKIVTIARDFGYPSRSMVNIPWSSTTKPGFLLSKSDNLRPIVSFMYTSSDLERNWDGVDIDAHSFSSGESVEPANGILVSLLAFLQKMKLLGQAFHSSWFSAYRKQ